MSARPGASQGGRMFAGILGFTLVSRLMGFLREAIIALGFGFSRATDSFYQLAATPTYLLTSLGGPFSTAYIVWSNRADAPGERLRVAFVLHWLVLAAAAVASGFFAVILWLEFARPVRSPQILPGLLMALSCMAGALIGLGAAVANARARFVQAQAVLFVNNCGFVLLLTISALLLRRKVELALTSAFAGAALIAALYAWRVIRGDNDWSMLRQVSPAERRSVLFSLRKVFLPMLGMASLETAGFLASQAAVLGLAAMSGAGVTSAGALAQRIALTANGLVIGPLANVAMVRLAKLEGEAARRYLLQTAARTLAGLTLTAVVLSFGAMLVTRHGHSPNLILLAGLIPAYTVWLIAQGANIMLNRMSFARGTVRLYTGVTLAGYAAATLVRYAIWRGAGVELAAALAILAGAAWRRSESPAAAVS
jgi:peptidoglycan biosynthesis protein MviN/MurJ (putative lipid II flippase)